MISYTFPEFRPVGDIAEAVRAQSALRDFAIATTRSLAQPANGLSAGDLNEAALQRLRRDRAATALLDLDNRIGDLVARAERQANEIANRATALFQRALAEVTPLETARANRIAAQFESDDTTAATQAMRETFRADVHRGVRAAALAALAMSPYRGGDLPKIAEAYLTDAAAMTPKRDAYGAPIRTEPETPLSVLRDRTSIAAQIVRRQFVEARKWLDAVAKTGTAPQASALELIEMGNATEADYATAAKLGLIMDGTASLGSDARLEDVSPAGMAWPHGAGSRDLLQRANGA